MATDKQGLCLEAPLLCVPEVFCKISCFSEAWPLAVEALCQCCSDALGKLEEP